jgi:hypothetical protein
MSAWITPDELARLMGEVDRRCDEMVDDAIRGGWFEGVDAHRADALVDLARPNSAAPSGPDSMVHVVVDYEALMRGHTVAGETCEIPGIGPVPVTVARRLSQDAFLKVLVAKGVDVVAVAHGGKTIPAHLRSALEVRDPKCIVPRCDVRHGLQIDHRDTFGRTQVTKLDDLARLCSMAPPPEDLPRLHVPGRPRHMAVDPTREPRRRPLRPPEDHHLRPAVLTGAQSQHSSEGIGTLIRPGSRPSCVTGG